jgi:hypothetical protein
MIDLIPFVDPNTGLTRIVPRRPITFLSPKFSLATFLVLLLRLLEKPYPPVHSSNP